jgi:hypothetical protein
VLVTTLVGGLSFAPLSASAATVWNYGEAVIAVTTGAKNYSNHTQYVDNITVIDPGSLVCDGGTYEAWAGTVWYAKRVICTSTYGTTANITTFTINHWVPSGSGVCGSFWRYSTRPKGWWRHVACITIKV